MAKINLQAILDEATAAALESVGKENRQLRQQLETATALLKKVHEDATPMSGGYRGYLVDGSTISAIGMLMKAREVTNG